MPVTPPTVKGLEIDFPDIQVVAHQSGEDGSFVAAVAVTVGGIKGGGSTLPQDYTLLLDVTRIDDALPRVWVSVPEDRAIRHVNIFRSTCSDGECPWVGGRLPYLCWFTFENGWHRAEVHQRTLGAALEFARQLLNTENHDSPAR